MPQFPIEKMLPKAEMSVYRLVRMAAIRALELSEGKPCLLENPGTDKFTSMALAEIVAGKVETVNAEKIRKEMGIVDEEPQSEDEE